LSILSGIAASVTASSAHLGKVGSLVNGFDRAMEIGLIFIVFAVILAITIIRQPRRPVHQSQNNEDESGDRRLKMRTVTET